MKTMRLILNNDLKNDLKTVSGTRTPPQTSSGTAVSVSSGPHSRWPFKVSLFAALMLAAQLWTSPAAAQLKGKLAEKPILVGYARDVGPQQVLDYATRLTEQLKIGEQFRKDISNEEVQARRADMYPKTEHPLYGVAVYMVSGLIPSFEALSFQQVIDEADAKRLVDGRGKQWGENGTTEDIGNGCYKALFRNSYEFELPPGNDGSEYKDQNQGGWELKYEIIEKEGKKFVRQTQTIINRFRYHDSLLFEAGFDELYTMELPAAADVASGVDSGTDLGFDAYLDRIPNGIRMLGWNMLSSAVAAQLQQRDGEPDVSYNARRSSGDFGLALTKSVLFDVDHSEGWLRFAGADERSLRGELKIRARNNSDLSRQLLETAGVSRFAPILSDNAAITAHVSARLSDEATPMFLSLGEWLTETIRREFPGDAAMSSSAEAVAATLAGIAEHRNLELLLKLGWSAESGGVIYGGLQLHDNPDLLKSVHHFLVQAPGASSFVEFLDDDGNPRIRITLPDNMVSEIRAETGMSMTHVWLAHADSCLWFAAGAEQSKEMLNLAISRCAESSRAARTPLVSVNVDMERWASYPQDDPAGIAQLMWYLDENAWWFPPSPMTAFALSQFGAQVKPDPILQRVMDLGGDQRFWLTVESDDSGILVNSSLGLVIANYMLARMVNSQEQMMAEVQRQNQERIAEAQKQVEALKKQAEAVPASEPQATPTPTPTPTPAP